MKRFRLPQTAFVSGWMAVRGARRRRGTERGFVMSDHADWEGLLQSVRETGARQVYVTHGNSDGLARYLREVEGISAEPLEGGFAAERGDAMEEGPGPGDADQSGPQAASMDSPSAPHSSHADPAGEPAAPAGADGSAGARSR
jgi:putative mRNA 3-end processing factor